MISTAIASAYFLPLIDSPSLTQFLIQNRLGVTSANTAMQIVQVIATAAITITSIAFSMTIVALVMASNQFGPRLIQNFMQNKWTQCVLGVFTATFVFCLLVLSQITIGSQIEYFPTVSVILSMILGVVCVFVLIFFIHHVATSIRADNVVKHIASALMHDMHLLQSSRVSQPSDNRGTALNKLVDIDEFEHSTQVRCHCDGYIQAIDYTQIIALADEVDGIVVMHYRAGQYLVPNTPIGTLHSQQSFTGDIYLEGAFVIGEERTALQDPLFAINQLVEMAVRALSPSLDDPFTAANCIDRLASAMASFKRTNLPKNTILNAEGYARILSKDVDFDDLFEGAYMQIRQAAVSHPFVILHLLDTFITLVTASQSAAHMVHAVKKQLSSIQETIDEKNVFANKVDANSYNSRIAILKELIDSHN